MEHTISKTQTGYTVAITEKKRATYVADMLDNSGLCDVSEIRMPVRSTQAHILIKPTEGTRTEDIESFIKYI
jgi:7-keto-8-aminopelargonate synthetase-like enzyme